VTVLKEHRAAVYVRYACFPYSQSD